MNKDYENAKITIQGLKNSGQSVAEIAAKFQQWELPFTIGDVINMYYSEVVFYEFQIHKDLTSLNEYIKHERGNRYAAANLKKKNTDICIAAAKSMRQVMRAGEKEVSKAKLTPLPDRQYNIIIEWTFTNRRTDPDNHFFAIKFILDGLVASGMLSGDTCKQIGFIFHSWQIGKKFNVKVKLF